MSSSSKLEESSARSRRIFTRSLLYHLKRRGLRWYDAASELRAQYGPEFINEVEACSDYQRIDRPAFDFDAFIELADVPALKQSSDLNGNRSFSAADILEVNYDGQEVQEIPEPTVWGPHGPLIDPEEPSTSTGGKPGALGTSSRPSTSISLVDVMRKSLSSKIKPISLLKPVNTYSSRASKAPEPQPESKPQPEPQSEPQPDYSRLLLIPPELDSCPVTIKKRYLIRRCFESAFGVRETARVLATSHPDLAPNYCTVKEWFTNFRNGHLSLVDQKTLQNVKKTKYDHAAVEAYFLANPGATTLDAAHAFGYTVNVVHRILSERRFIKKFETWVKRDEADAGAVVNDAQLVEYKLKNPKAKAWDIGKHFGISHIGINDRLRTIGFIIPKDPPKKRKERPREFPYSNRRPERDGAQAGDGAQPPAEDERINSVVDELSALLAEDEQAVRSLEGSLNGAQDAPGTGDSLYSQQASMESQGPSSSSSFPSSTWTFPPSTPPPSTSRTSRFTHERAKFIPKNPRNAGGRHKGSRNIENKGFLISPLTGQRITSITDPAFVLPPGLPPLTRAPPPPLVERKFTAAALSIINRPEGAPADPPLPRPPRRPYVGKKRGRKSKASAVVGPPKKKKKLVAMAKEVPLIVIKDEEDPEGDSLDPTNSGKPSVGSTALTTSIDASLGSPEAREPREMGDFRVFAKRTSKKPPVGSSKAPRAPRAPSAGASEDGPSRLAQAEPPGAVFNNDLPAKQFFSLANLNKPLESSLGVTTLAVVLGGEHAPKPPGKRYLTKKKRKLMETKRREELATTIGNDSASNQSLELQVEPETELEAGAHNLTFDPLANLDIMADFGVDFGAPQEKGGASAKAKVVVSRKRIKTEF